MRLLVSLLLFSIMPFAGFSQIEGDGEVYLTMERINPTFRGGGMKEFYAYINSEFDYSKVAAKGKMVAVFTINEEGEIKNITVTQFLDVNSAAEIIRVLKKAPKWVPAKRNGKSISVDIQLPLNFGSSNKAVDESAVAKEEQANPKSDNEEIESDLVPVTAVESKPEYPGGMNAFYQLVIHNMKTPEDKKFKGGKLVISFVIEKDGSLTDFKIEKDPGFGTGDEAIRVLKMSQKWIPAKQNGKPVRCMYHLPITLSSN
jgi:hypothetical protein